MSLISKKKGERIDKFLGENLGDLSRIGGGTAPRPIGHAHKIGLQLGNLFHR